MPLGDILNSPHGGNGLAGIVKTDLCPLSDPTYLLVDENAMLAVVAGARQGSLPIGQDMLAVVRMDAFDEVGQT